MKTGPLNEREWEIMKTHTTRGGDTLREVIEQHHSQTGEGARFLRLAMEIAYDLSVEIGWEQGIRMSRRNVAS